VVVDSAQPEKDSSEGNDLGLAESSENVSVTTTPPPSPPPTKKAKVVDEPNGTADGDLGGGGTDTPSEESSAGGVTEVVEKIQADGKEPMSVVQAADVPADEKCILTEANGPEKMAEENDGKTEAVGATATVEEIKTAEKKDDHEQVLESFRNKMTG
jgi:hypothetical protein